MASRRLRRALALASSLALAAPAWAQDKAADLARAVAAAERGNAVVAEPLLRTLALDNVEAAAWLGFLLVQHGDEDNVKEA